MKRVYTPCGETFEGAVQQAVAAATTEPAMFDFHGRWYGVRQGESYVDALARLVPERQATFNCDGYVWTPRPELDPNGRFISWPPLPLPQYLPEPPGSLAEMCRQICWQIDLRREHVAALRELIGDRPDLATVRALLELLDSALPPEPPPG